MTPEITDRRGLSVCLPVGKLTLEGFLKPVPAFNVTGLKAGESRSVESKGKAAGIAK